MPIATPVALDAVPPTTVIKSASDNTAIVMDKANSTNLELIISLRESGSIFIPTLSVYL